MTQQNESATQTQELKPCPWCLGPAEITSVIGGDEGDGYVWHVFCGEDNDCTMMPDLYSDSENEAIRRWNTRAPSGTEQVSGKLASAVSRALQQFADLEDQARQAAGHTEEAGEVCTADCLACNDPVRAVMRDLREARNEAFQRGRSEQRLREAQDEAKRHRNATVWKETPGRLVEDQTQ